MTVTRRVTTLTLIGLMAAIIFPVCVNAQVGAPTPTGPLDVVVEGRDLYDTTPTLTWTCESGPTVFSLSIVNNGGDPITVESVSAGTLTDGKWVSDESRICAEDTEGKTICEHTYTPADPLAAGTVAWTVTGQRVAADTSPTDDVDYTTDASEESSFTIFGNVLLSIATDVTDAEPGDTVTATVSLDNQTNGSVSLNSLKFDVDFTAAAFTAPAEVTVQGAVSSITPTINPTAGKLSFEFVGEIQTGSGAIVAIPFTVNADATPADYTFTLAGNEATSDTVNPPEGETQNPSTVGEAATVTVAAAVEPGDVGGAEGLDLADAILPMQVDAGMDVTVNVGADVDGDGKIGVVESSYVLKELAKP